MVGNGKTDFPFVLDQAGINQVNSIIYSNSYAASVNIALESTMSVVHGGPESFLVQGSAANYSSTPEPSMFLLIGAGLVGAAVLRRRA